MCPLWVSGHAVGQREDCEREELPSHYRVLPAPLRSVLLIETSWKQKEEISLKGEILAALRLWLV